MRRPFVPAIAALIAFSVSACELERLSLGAPRAGLEPIPPDAWLQTDRLTYSAFFTATTIEFDVGFTFTNRARFAVAIPRCVRPFRPALDKLIAGVWVEVLRHAEACVAEPLVIGPRRSQRFVLRVRAGRPNSFIEPQFRTAELPGIYRLRWQVYEHDPTRPDGVGPLLPLEFRVSNEFRIIP
jgi:hypothetical protein